MRTLAALLLFAVAATAQAPTARAVVVPDSGAVPGQPLELQVTLLVPTWFTTGPKWPEIEVDGALCLLPTTPAVNSTERIDGATWSGQTRTYYICPLRDGAFEVPSFEVVVRYAIDTKPSEPLPLATPALSFSVQLPAAAQGSRFFVTTTSFTLEEKLEPEPVDLMVGDAVKRVITMTARDTFGLFLPPLRLEQQAGLRAYPGTPEVDDRGGQRGEPRVAERTESATYLFEQPGSYTLPALRIPWWNLEGGVVEVAELPGHSFDVAPNPDLEAAPAAEIAPATKRPTAWWSILLVVVVAGAGAWALRHLPRRLAAWRQRRVESEAGHYRRVARACRTGDASACMRALLAWRSKAMRAARDNPGLREQIDRLDSHLYGEGEAWSPAALHTALKSARRRVREMSRAARTERVAPLNP